MDGFSVSRWQRYGQDRLFVNRTGGGKAVGWYDFKAREVVIADESCRTAVLEALADELPADLLAVRAASSPVQAPASPVASAAALDFALNKPGDALRRKILEVEPVWWKRRFARWLPKEMTGAHSWAVGLHGERIVGGRLDRLRRDGWEVLHSIQLPSGADIDHLVIGRPGVFTVNTKHHRGAAVWQGDHAITVNRVTKPYLPISKGEAERVARLLASRVGFPVPVRPVLAVVGAASVTTKNALPTSVLLVDGSRVDQNLSGLSPTLSPAQVEALFAVARDGGTWVG